MKGVLMHFKILSVSLNPSMSGLPGGAELQNLANALGSWSLIAALAALIIGAALWALGSHSQNYHQASAGKKAVLVSAAAALLIGAAPSIINFFYSAGQSVH
jgi:hypothetical protein